MVDRRSSFGPFLQSGHHERTTWTTMDHGMWTADATWTRPVDLYGPLWWPGPGPPNHPVVHRKTCGPLTGHMAHLLVRIDRKGPQNPQLFFYCIDKIAP